MATLLGGSRWDNEEDVYEEARRNHFSDFDTDYDDMIRDYYAIDEG